MILRRRHLDETQRAMVGARIKPMFESEARERQKGGQGGGLLFANLQKANAPVHAHVQAAESVNVSPRSVESASKVLRVGRSLFYGRPRRQEGGHPRRHVVKRSRRPDHRDRPAMCAYESPLLSSRH